MLSNIRIIDSANSDVHNTSLFPLYLPIVQLIADALVLGYDLPTIFRAEQTRSANSAECPGYVFTTAIGSEIHCEVRNSEAFCGDMCPRTEEGPHGIATNRAVAVRCGDFAA